MGRTNQLSLVASAGIDAAEGSIGSRLVSQELTAMAAELKRIIADGRVTNSELRRLHRQVMWLIKQAEASEEAADLGASASNKCDVAERRLVPLARTNPDVRAALRLVASDHEAERAAGVAVLSDYRAQKSSVPGSSGDAA